MSNLLPERAADAEGSRKEGQSSRSRRMPAARASIAALKLSGVRRAFPQAGTELEVLRAVDFSIHSGELVALVGPSGAGKSTLLHIAGLLERPTDGMVEVLGVDVSQASDARRTEVRRKSLGFVYQFHHLLPEFSALENVVIPQLICGLKSNTATARARDLLHMVGLSERATHRPAKLSGGEQQRVAIARALANAPAILLADEPTGNLDPKTAMVVFEMLRALVRGVGLAALVATHNLEMAARMDRVLVLKDGRVVEA